MGRANCLRLVGGLLFAAGAAVLLARKGGDWSNLAVLATLLVPMVVLLGLGFLDPPEARPAWRSTYLVLGTGFVAAVLLQFVNWIGGSPGTDLNLAWIFAVTAAVGVYAALAYGARYALFLGALALGLSWISVWDKVLGSPSLNTIRWIFFALGVVYVLVAFWRRADDWHADVLTAGGVAFVVIAIIDVAYGLFVTIFSSDFGRALLPGSPDKPSEWWTISLLVESVGLIAYAAHTRRRGPGYAGGVGLALFVVQVGINLSAVFSGHRPDKIDAWPLFLLIGGGLAIAWSFGLREPAGELDE